MTKSADPDQLASSEHCLLRQGMSCSVREELITIFQKTCQVSLWKLIKPLKKKKNVGLSFPNTITDTQLNVW